MNAITKNILTIAACAVLTLGATVTASAETRTDPTAAPPEYEKVYGDGGEAVNIQVDGHIIPESEFYQPVTPRFPDGEQPSGPAVNSGDRKPSAGKGKTTPSVSFPRTGDAGAHGGAGAVEEAAEEEPAETAAVPSPVAPEPDAVVTDGAPPDSSIGGATPPQSSASNERWSFLSLIFALLSIVSAASALISASARRRREESPTGLPGGEGQYPVAPVFLTLSVALGAATPISWLVVDDVTLPVTLFNAWTPLIGILFAVQLAFRLLYAGARKRAAGGREA
jgi:hypothetical protein